MTMQRRLMLSFALFALLISMLFGAYCVVLAYSLEDEFFERLLTDETDRQLIHRREHGEWTTPRMNFVVVYPDVADFPADLRRQFDIDRPRREFFGDQSRYYHVRTIDAADAEPAYLVAEVSDHLVVRPVRGTIFAVLVWGGGAVMLTAVALGAWFARRATRPLSKLAAEIAAIDPQRLPADFSDPRGNDEVSILARGIGRMIRRIRDFVERERLFTRDASHELRTPIAVIRSATERLGALDQPSTTNQQLEFIRAAAQQMDQTVNLLLSLAREENIESQPASAAVLPIVESVIVEYAHLLERAPATVRVDILKEFRMPLPPAVLRILLANLIGNAFQHASAGTIVIDTQDGVLRIADNGPGIAATRRESLYQPFNKDESSSGFGLGLSIVRRLCDRYRIKLGIDSTAGGTTVTISKLDSMETN